jgi:hypothetical protein
MAEKKHAMTGVRHLLVKGVGPVPLQISEEGEVLFAKRHTQMIDMYGIGKKAVSFTDFGSISYKGLSISFDAQEKAIYEAHVDGMYKFANLKVVFNVISGTYQVFMNEGVYRFTLGLEVVNVKCIHTVREDGTISCSLQLVGVVENLN